MNAASFICSEGDVWWLGPKPVRLSHESISDLLDVFHREGCCAAYNELHEAELRAGGISRTTSFSALAGMEGRS